MSNYTATITRQRNGAAFVDNKYSCAHSWQFDGGIELAASASPHVVPLPFLSGGGPKSSFANCSMTIPRGDAGEYIALATVD